MPKIISREIKKKKNAKKEGPSFSLPSGLEDVLPHEEDFWKEIWGSGLSVAEIFHFHYIDTPPVEYERLFSDSKKNEEKPIFVIKRGKESLALKNCAVLPVLRSYHEHHLGYFSSPLKVFFFGPVFKHKKHGDNIKKISREWGFAVLGDNDPVYDVEIILASLHFLKNLKIKNLYLKVNMIGCKICRNTYKDKVKHFYFSRKNELCSSCRKSLDKKPFSAFSCESNKCKNTKTSAPIILDYMCQSCNNYFKSILELIEDNGIVYESDPHLLNGNEGYNRLRFEIKNQNGRVLAEGGRCDYLSEKFGGRQIPATYGILFLSQIISSMKEEEIEVKGKRKPKVFFIAVGDEAKKRSTRIINSLRSNHIAVAEVLGKKLLKSQLKIAEKLKTPFAVIIGQKEVFEDTAILRDMETGAQETIVASRLIEEIKKKIR